VTSPFFAHRPGAWPDAAAEGQGPNAYTGQGVASDRQSLLPVTPMAEHNRNPNIPPKNKRYTIASPIYGNPYNLNGTEGVLLANYESILVDKLTLRMACPDDPPEAGVCDFFFHLAFTDDTAVSQAITMEVPHYDQYADTVQWNPFAHLYTFSQEEKAKRLKSISFQIDVDDSNVPPWGFGAEFCGEMSFILLLPRDQKAL